MRCRTQCRTLRLHARRPLERPLQPLRRLRRHSPHNRHTLGGMARWRRQNPHQRRRQGQRRHAQGLLTSAHWLSVGVGDPLAVRVRCLSTV